jgi:hypothetical protein
MSFFIFDDPNIAHELPLYYHFVISMAVSIIDYLMTLKLVSINPFKMASARADQSGSATPREEGGHGLAVGGRERLCINCAQVGAFVFGEVRRTGMGGDEAINDLGQRGARGGVKAGVGAFHQGLKAGIHT